MFSSIKNRLKEEKGQATVEAAFLIPVMMAILLLMLEPGIVLYDKIVMNSAVAEGARLLATQDASNTSYVDDFVKRRLGAIPSIDIFHVHSGDCSYAIETSGDANSEFVSVKLTNRIKALPLLDICLRAFGGVSDSGEFEIMTESSLKVQNSWARGY